MRRRAQCVWRFIALLAAVDFLKTGQEFFDMDKSGGLEMEAHQFGTTAKPKQGARGQSPPEAGTFS